MSVHTVRVAWDSAWVTPEAYPDTKGAVEATLLSRCHAAVVKAGLSAIPSRPHTCHWQTQLLPGGLPGNPAAAIPWVEGDIIPEGYHVMWLCVVSLQAYDPQE